LRSRCQKRRFRRELDSMEQCMLRRRRFSDAGRASAHPVYCPMLVRRKKLSGRVPTLVSALVLAGAIVGIPTPAAASSYTARLCVAMPEMLAFGSAFGGNAAGLQKLSENGSVLNIARTSAGFRLTSSGTDVGDVAVSGATAATSCRIFPTDQKLWPTGTISASYIAAFAKVMAYRRGHSWPSQGANATPSNVDIIMAAYNGYVTVSLADNFVHRDSSGRALLGCDGGEDYRVTLSTGLVLPFDGCAEGHSRVLPSSRYFHPNPDAAVQDRGCLAVLRCTAKNATLRQRRRGVSISGLQS
jgi:hypothetical protein